MRNLICWCCGAMFTGLQDVNHDDGYWLCIDCTMVNVVSGML